ncbi:TolC family protein, partial [Pseudomonas aeruginosa]
RVGDSSRWRSKAPRVMLAGTASSAPPTLRLAAQEVARGEAQVDLEKRQRIPNLTVSIGSKYDQTARDGRGER